VTLSLLLGVGLVLSPQASSLDPQGPGAKAAAGLWWLMVVLGGVVFLIMAALLVIGLRREGQGSRRPPEKWISVGVAATVVLLIVVFAATLVAMRDVTADVPPDALVVEVVGHQWWWEVHYPEQGVTTANELHLPVGRDVALRLSSSDVIHSFWVPALAGKMDLLPDRENTLVLRADEGGEHASECAEFCGLQHYQMGLTVTAEAPEAFSTWIDRQASPAAEPQTEAGRRGLDLFLASKCVECHTIRGTAAEGNGGPDLTHLASRQQLGAGALPNTGPDLTAWITDPHTVKEGVDMPAAELGEDEIAALVAYLGSLK
jgi:cytochrome c oxidase subunit 2